MAVVKNHGDKKELGEQDTDQDDLRSGLAEVLLLDLNLKKLLKKAIPQKMKRRLSLWRSLQKINDDEFDFLLIILH